MTRASTVGVSSGSDTIPTVASTGRVAFVVRATALLGPPVSKQGLGILGTWQPHHATPAACRRVDWPGQR